jgi:hypothetical protein
MATNSLLDLGPGSCNLPVVLFVCPFVRLFVVRVLASWNAGAEMHTTWQGSTNRKL